MKYEVVLTREAQKQLHEAAVWWAENRSSEQAVLWLAGFERAITGLGERPERHRLAPESQKLGVELRQLLYGASRNPTHRAVFRIGKRLVEVIAIRHLAQD